MANKFIQSTHRSVLTQKVHARLAIHLKLDHLIRNSLKAYLSHHAGDSEYWERYCQPYLDLLPEHYKFTQFTSRPLTHYGEYMRMIASSYPQQEPSKKRTLAFLELVETWYWREYP